MAHKKGMGSSRNGRESESKRLGVKLFGGQFARAGNIIVRQRGTKYHPGKGVGLGKDHTIYALVDGIVTFKKKKNNKNYVSVIPIEQLQKELEKADTLDVKQAEQPETVDAKNTGTTEAKAEEAQDSTPPADESNANDSNGKEEA